MSVVTGSLDLLVRLRVRDHAHLRELLLSKIFQINGVQRTETFLSLADMEPGNFAAAHAGPDEQAAGRVEEDLRARPAWARQSRPRSRTPLIGGQPDGQ